MGYGSPTGKREDVLDKPVKALTSSRVVEFKDGKAIIEANRERANPYTPWSTLIPGKYP